MRFPLSPSVPLKWQSDFADYMRLAARRIAVVTAWIVFFLLPAVQYLDYHLHGDAAFLWWDAFWRLPPFLMAILILALSRLRPAGRWPRPLMLLLALSLVTMMAGLTGMHYDLGSESAHQMLTGLILLIVAMAIGAVYGLRDLAWICGLPLMGLSLYLAVTGAWAGLNVMDVSQILTAVIVSGAIAELLYRGHVEAFLARWELKQNAMTDPLTALLNRRAMDEQLAAEAARAHRHGTSYALVMADLDHFKRVNDTHGHEAGDDVLRLLASRMNQSVRAEDVVARWGGEEFLILLRETGADDANVVAEKVRQTVGGQSFKTRAGALSITISLGIAVHAGDESVEATVKRADKALYRAKHEGRNRSVLDDSAS